MRVVFRDLCVVCCRVIVSLLPRVYSFVIVLFVGCVLLCVVRCVWCVVCPLLCVDSSC